MAGASLERYQAKRDFTKTKEPRGGKAPAGKKAAGGVFVIHKHAARRLHYDLRLEHAGVLWSWAVTRGPSLDPAEKRLAVHVEDHPFEYGSFEGTIPQGQYGAGSVIVWDEGTWAPELDPDFAMKKGHIAFTLDGHKLKGRWHLVRLKPRGGEKTENWLLMKVEDEAASTTSDILVDQPNSVKSGASIEAIGRGEVDGAETWDVTKTPGTDGPSMKTKPAPKAKAAAKTKGKPAATEAKEKPAAGKAAKPAKAAKTGGKPGKTAALPTFHQPCLATLVEQPPSGEDWLHEVKFDGYRVQALVSQGKVALMTRSGLDWTERFAGPVTEALAKLPCDDAAIDGEIIVPDDNGAASFSALQLALSEGRTGALILYGFDILSLDGEDLTGEPLLARKERLEHLLEGADEHGPLRFSEHFVEPGKTMLRHACRLGLEGIVSKRVDAPYRSGRGRDWVKSKCTQRQEFVIAGYVPSGAAGRELGSILVGYREGGKLVPAGRVGTGFTRRVATDLKAKLDAQASKTSAFEGKPGRERGIVWVEPTLVAEIEFRAWTASHVLRHASFLGLREDKEAEEVVAEVPVPVEKAAPKSAKAKVADKPKPAAKAKPAQASTPETSVKLTNPEKLLWPDDGFTKKDLLAYYARAWPFMERFVCDRPLSLVRAPNGIKGHSFFQKHGSAGMHEAIRTVKDTKDGEDLLFIKDFDGLAALVQLGTLEVHVWGSTIDAVETPDQIVFDLDPDEGVTLERLRKATLDVRDRLGDLGFESFLKTSGGKGYHVVVPLKPKADWTKVKGFAHDFAKALAEADPSSYTAVLSKKARRGRIFIDYLRNGRGATAIAPFSTRARPGAPISMLLDWDELDDVTPNQFKASDPAVHDRGWEAWQGFFKPAKALTL